MTDWLHELDIASRLARKAGQVIMKIYEQDFSISYKGTNDPVTEADQLANTLIVEGLAEHFPHDRIIAEESPMPTGTQQSDRVWYVDPLDGTKEFIARNGEFSTMIGLTINGTPQLGVVYRPTEDQLFAGITNQDSWVEHQGTRRSLQAARAKSLSSLTLVASRSHRSSKLSALKQTLNIREEHPMGSVGLKIGFIGTGGADLYMEPGPYTKSWDACAPEAILRGAGGCFTDVHGNPIQYDGREIRNVHGIVGSTKDCHQQVIDALTSLCVSCEG